MPEKTVTIFVTDEGVVDVERFAKDPDLAKVKQVIDGLRGSNDELKPIAARAREYDKLGTPEQIATWKKDAEQAQALRDQITELEGKANMTDEEKKELETLREKAKAFGDLDPEAAKKAIEYQARKTKEEQITAAFEAAGLNPKAALGIAGMTDLETRVQSEEKDGKTVKVAQVKVGEEWKPLDKHVEATYADFMPVLKPSQEKKPGSSPIDPVRPAGGKDKPSSLEGAIAEHYNR